jgi:glycosyltransferase involved in cell wall biosynthesis
MVTLAKGLDSERFEQRILVGAVGGNEGDYLALRAPDVDVVAVPGLGRDPSPLGDPRALHRIRREIRGFRPHIIHTHTAKAGALGRIAARVTGSPNTVHSFHGHLLHGYFSPATTRAVTFVERTLARRTTALVAEGARVRDELLSAGVGRAGQWSVLPPGIDLPPAPARDSARRALDLTSSASIIAFVARLTAVKRPDRFARVALEVARSKTDSHFVIVGEGELLDELRAELKPLGPRAHFVGWRSDVEVAYAAADIVVLTSDNEGMPYTLIEAALSGRPVVATKVGSVDEVVDDGVTGILTDCDAGSLARGVLRILDDAGLRDRMGRAAATRAQREFSASRLVDDAASLYDRIASATG